jgi:Tfp pilus assembly protein PilF
MKPASHTTKEVKMIKALRISLAFFAFSVVLVSGCATKKHSFVIDAPPQYSSDVTLKTMQMQPFSSNQARYGGEMTNLVRGGIAKEGYIQVVQGNAESKLSGSLNVGNVLSDQKSQSFECSKVVNKKQVKSTCHEYTYSKKVDLTANYNLQYEKDNSVLSGDSLQWNFSKEWSSQESAADARSQAPSDNEIITAGIKDLSTKIVFAVTPHKEKVERELQEGDDENLKLGIKYLEHGRADQAIAIWDQVVTKSNVPKNKAAAYYNIGVIKESQGKYKDAFHLYSEANTILPVEELYIKSMTRVEKLEEKSSAVRKWSNK